jgi:hypothetical protein
MRLRLLIEVNATPDVIDALPIQVERQAPVEVDLLDGYVPLSGRLVGAVPTEDGGE